MPSSSTKEEEPKNMSNINHTKSSQVLAFSFDLENSSFPSGRVEEEKEAITSKATHEPKICERMKRHREEVAGRVVIPETWGQEKLLGDWMDYSSFDKLLAPSGIASAREALVAEGRRSRTGSHRPLMRA
ncbi:hypothetical protein Tsubulata_010234 [Turnera subulata]|uniref:Protein BIC1 n=1 Tax=Turnera subulata TaxID=218843 RepID=A0A9Q0JM78_9ROSI|nr:hypothetical protein Tsubulata_010234 [Turnera subulata]